MMGSYTLFGKKIVIKESGERFFDIQYRVWQAEAAASSDFDHWYEGCGDILTVLNGYEKKSAELIIKYSNEPLFQELSQLGIYDISENRYDDECLDFSESSAALDVVVDKYNDIIAQQAAEEEYRAERKAGRGRVVGGGFGVGGALKGMATAGAMNAISGAGHSLANAIGNAGSAMEAASSKRALYNSDATKKVLRAAICCDILSCFNAHINLVNERKGDHFINCFDSDKGGALLESAKKVPEKRVDLLIESFQNCPWRTDLLSYIFATYKEERKNIWDAGIRFHVDLHKEAEKAFSDSYTVDAQNSEEKAQAVKADILAQMKVLGITVSETVDRIEKDGVSRILGFYNFANEEQRQEIFDKLEHYDASERIKATVIHEKGVWELAQKYKVRFNTEEIETILKRAYTESAQKSEVQAQVAKQKIKIMMAALGANESATFDNLESDCISRLCPDYQTADESTCNEMIKKIHAYDALEKNKKPFLYKIQARIEAIWSAEDGEIFDNLYLNTNILDSEELKSAIEFVKQKGRTSSSGKYLSALSSCTAENIKKVKAYQKSITKFFLYGGFSLIGIGIILLLVDMGFILSVAVAGIGVVMLSYYYGLKKIYNTLTLGGTIKHPILFVVDTTKTNKPSKSEKENTTDMEEKSNDKN